MNILQIKIKKMETKMSNKEMGLLDLLSTVLGGSIIILVLLFSGCKTQQPIIEREIEQKEIHDSRVESEKTSADSTIGIKADSAYMRLQLACDSMGNVYMSDIEKLNGDRTALNLRVESLISQLADRNKGVGKKDLVIDIDCAADSLTLIVERQKEYIKELTSTIDSLSVKENKTEFVKVVPTYYKNCTKGFWWLLIIDLIVIALVLVFLFGKNTPWGKVVFSIFKFLQK